MLRPPAHLQCYLDEADEAAPLLRDSKPSRPRPTPSPTPNAIPSTRSASPPTSTQNPPHNRKTQNPPPFANVGIPRGSLRPRLALRILLRICRILAGVVLLVDRLRRAGGRHLRTVVGVVLGRRQLEAVAVFEGPPPPHLGTVAGLGVWPLSWDCAGPQAASWETY